MARILIVDDDKHLRFLLKSILETHDHQCTHVSDTAEAREKLSQSEFDLLLSDVVMPNESGIELARFTHERYPDTAIIMITGIDDILVSREAIEIGVFDYLLKPLEKNRVLISVANALRRRVNVMQRKKLEKENRVYREQLEKLVQERTRNLEQAVSRLETTGDALRESQARFENLFESSKDTIYFVKLDGQILKVNKAGQELFGYSEQESCSLNVLKLYKDPAERQRLIQKLTQDGFVKDYPVDMVKKTGAVIHALATASVWLDAEGNLIEIQGIIRDITELKRAEAERAHLATAISQADEAIVITDRDAKIEYVNPAFERITGYSRSEAIGQATRLLKSGQHDHTFYTSLWNTIGHGKVWSGRFINRRKDGKLYEEEAQISPVRDRTGKMVGYVAVKRDVTREKTLERQLRQAQKLESLGTLAGGIAHEINTPIQYVGDNTRFLQDAFRDLSRLEDKYQELVAAAKKSTGALQALAEGVVQTAEEIDRDYLLNEIPTAIAQSLEGVERVSGIVRAMKEFSHPGGEEKTAIDINRAIESTVTVSRNEWKYVAELQLDLDPNLPQVPCLPGEFNQVILNMIVNAAHAIGEVGKSDPKSQKGRIDIRTRLKGEWAEIQIADSGCGIPSQNREKVFVPFFTTKEVGRGTGQGLAISHTVIVEKHGGSIDFDSQIGQGTTFTIRLPLQKVEAERSLDETECSVCG